MEQLTGEVPAGDQQARADRVREQIMGSLPFAMTPGWAQKQLQLMPDSYLLGTEPSRIIAHLRCLQGYDAGSIVISGNYDEVTCVSTYTVVLGEGRRPGIFANIAGVLASAGFQILSAQIVTRSDGLVIDTFETIDTDYTGAPPLERREEITDKVRQVLLGGKTVQSLLSSRFVPRKKKELTNAAPTKVEIDNTSSDRFSIIDVFATDRQGLLYVITQTLAEKNLSIHGAKIATHIDQAVDAFYVTDEGGEKLTDTFRLTLLREELKRRIDAHAVP
jgi:[protein-PII] uridylyltransferase